MNKVRIIGGRWRRHLLRFPDNDELRPTHDRVRETVFNWLSNEIEGASCLDLFAGSGALGFEALSRGALKVVMIDSSSEAVSALKSNADTLGVMNCDIIQGVFPSNLPHFRQHSFDIIFLDPPYNKGLIEESIQWILKTECLKDQALVYIEAERAVDLDLLPDQFDIQRHKKTRTLQYALFSYNA